MYNDISNSYESLSSFLYYIYNLNFFLVFDHYVGFLNSMCDLSHTQFHIPEKAQFHLLPQYIEVTFTAQYQQNVILKSQNIVPYFLY